MKEWMVKWYAHIAYVLMIVWFALVVMGVSPLDSYGGISFAGIVLVDLLFGLMGLIGFFLSARRLLMFDFAALLFAIPFLHLGGIGAAPPWDKVLYLSPFVLLIALSYVLWRRS